MFVVGVAVLSLLAKCITLKHNSKIVKQVRINDTFLAVQVANKEDLKFIDLLDPWQTPGEVWWNDFGREIIVIGNVHENPELLESSF